MILLNRKFDLESFWTDLSQSSQSILLLDYDGTLSPFTPDRDQARPYDGVIDRLENLIARKSVRLIMVSGRYVERLKQLLNLTKTPEIWGNHGAEWYHPESGYQLLIGEREQEGLSLVSNWARQSGLDQVAEVKPAGAAFHWRGLSSNESQAIETRVVDYWQGEVERFDLQLHPFDGGIEIRPARFNKGTAVNRIIQTLNRSCPIAYLGDDLTDEDAFEQLGDKALKVLVNERSRPTKADIQIVPPIELLDFLDQWLERA